MRNDSRNRHELAQQSATADGVIVGGASAASSLAPPLSLTFNMKPAIFPIFTILVSLLTFSCGDRTDDTTANSDPSPEPMKRVLTVLQSDG